MKTMKIFAECSALSCQA